MDLRERPGASFVRHPWETARSDFFGALLQRTAANRGPARILDVGAGDAWLACRLSERCPGARIACWDASYTPELLAEISPALPERVSVHRVRPDGRFDLVLLLDVLEHVEDDRAFLASLLEESLAPGGRVLLSVPAWPCLYGRQDRTLGHLRRYTRARCRELLREVGLRRLAGGGLFYSLVPARWASVRLDRLRGLSGPLAGFELSWSHGARSARWVHRLLLLDGALARAAARLRLDLPGLSCWALCERSG